MTKEIIKELLEECSPCMLEESLAICEDTLNREPRQIQIKDKDKSKFEIAGAEELSAAIYQIVHNLSLNVNRLYRNKYMMDRSLKGFESFDALCHYAVHTMDYYTEAVKVDVAAIIASLERAETLSFQDVNKEYTAYKKTRNLFQEALAARTDNLKELYDFLENTQSLDIKLENFVKGHMLFEPLFKAMNAFPEGLIIERANSYEVKPEKLQYSLHSVPYNHN